MNKQATKSDIILWSLIILSNLEQGAIRIVWIILAIIALIINMINE